MRAGVSLTLKEMVTNAQLEALAAGQLDVGVMRPHSPQGELDTVVLGRERLMLAVPSRDGKSWPTKPTLAVPAGQSLYRVFAL
jgi:DNA-binding transcriptional LysR family regulator